MIIKTITALLIGATLNIGSPLVHADAPQPQVKPKNALQELFRGHARIELQKNVTKVIQRANKTRYVFSGDQPTGWDCSGLVRWVYGQSGITLPHSANAQGHLGHRVTTPKRGDIVVFAYPGRHDFNHAAIYLGQNLIIDANLEYHMTVIEPLSNFKHSQIRFVRVL